MRRVQAIKGNSPGDCNLYCSEECKLLCCEFKRVKYPEGFTPPNVEFRPEVKKSIRIKKLEEANYTCEFCDETKNLKLHHIKPVKLFPELTNDPGNILVVCEKCHHEEHSGPDGLSYAMIRDIAKEREGFYGI